MKIQNYQEIEFEEEFERSKQIGKLILLVAFTGIMLITSTYAWFTVQNDVLISGITGSVSSVEGMMVSLDGTNWTHDLVLTAEALKANKLNILPEELEPVSTTAVEDLDTNGEVTFYTGKYDGDKKLEGITAATKGYYAIDVYVQNSSKKSTDENGNQLYEVLQINKNSSISISGEEATGLQNTARVGIGVYTNSLDITSIGTTVTGATWGVLNDVTIWEPNANSHVDWVVSQNNKLTLAEAEQLTGADSQKTSKFGKKDIIPTYALTSTSVTAGTISDIYNWATLGTTVMSKQVTLQTVTGGIGVNPLNLPSVDGTSSFSIPANRVSKLRVYLWLEGQDVDTINHASHGGTITVNLGLTKNEEGITTISEISLDKQNAIVMDGESTTLTATVNADAEEELTWKSSNEEVATLEVTEVAKIGTVASTNDLGRTMLAKTGEVKAKTVTVKALREGETTITASNTNGTIVKECEITVEGITTSGTYLPRGFTEVSAATETEGLTIADSKGNQYVWVEVPKSLYNDSKYNIDTENENANRIPESEEDYDNIEFCLKKYTQTYRNGTSYTDTWFSEAQHGYEKKEDYNDLKHQMLKSVYTNGGFYVGKYETGIADTEPDVIDKTVEARKNSEQEIKDYEPVIQADAYPYNFVTCKQAQILAESMESGKRTSSLMFGVQWDLVLKYMEVKAINRGVASNTIIEELNSNSIDWGNYYESTWDITNEEGKYNDYDDINSKFLGWIDGPFPSKKSDDRVLLSTGAIKKFSKMGIYDFAGNVWEWTLEYTSNVSYPCAKRGGSYYDLGKYNPASFRNGNGLAYSDDNMGFRVSIF